MESDHLKFDFCIKSISLIFLENCKSTKPSFSQYFCDFELDPESIRIPDQVIFGQRKFLILTRFLSISVYWEFKVFDFPYTFAICAGSGFDPELDRSEFLAKKIADFETFWAVSGLLGF